MPEHVAANREHWESLRYFLFGPDVFIRFTYLGRTGFGLFRKMATPHVECNSPNISYLAYRQQSLNDV